MGSAVGYLMLDTSNFTSGFKSALADLKTFKDQSATVADKFSAAGSAMTSAGATMTKNVSLPILAVGTASVAAATQFESAMAEVAAISGVTGDDFEALSEKAQEMGRTTKFSASEAASALKYMALAGWKTEDMLNGIEGIMDLAAASGEDLASTSDIVTDSLTAFGLQASDSAHFADVLATAMSNSNTDVAGLGEAFKYVGPVAGAFGYTIEDVSIALGSMANAGIKGSSMGTSLRQALVQLTKPSSDAAEYMEKFGVTLFDDEGKTKDLMTIMQELRGIFGQTAKDVATQVGDFDALQAQVEENEDAWADYAQTLNLPIDQQEKLTALTEIFGARSMPAMLAIIQAGEDDFNNLSNAIYSADGKAQDMAETMQGTLKGQATILKSALEGAAISIGNTLIPMLTSAVQWVTRVVDWFNNLDESTKNVIFTILKVLAVIGPILLIGGKIIAGISTLIKVISVLKGVMLALNAVMLANPIFLIIAAIAALVAAFIYLWNNCEEFRQFWIDLWEGIKNTVITVWNAIKDFFVKLWTGLKTIAITVWTAVSEFFSNLWEGIKNVAVSIWEGIKNFFSNIWTSIKDGISSIWESMKAWFVDVINYPVEAIKSIGTLLYEAGKSIFTSLWDGLKYIWNSITSWISDGINWLIDKIAFWRDAEDEVSTEGLTGATVQGSYASGLDYVPSDRIVKVHEGEAILTKQENLERKQGGTAETLVIPITIGEEQIETVIVDLLKGEVRT